MRLSVAEARGLVERAHGPRHSGIRNPSVPADRELETNVPFDPGFRRENLITATVMPYTLDYKGPNGREVFLRLVRSVDPQGAAVERQLFHVEKPESMRGKGALALDAPCEAATAISAPTW